MKINFIMLAVVCLLAHKAEARVLCNPGPLKADVVAAEKAGLTFDGGDTWRKHMALLEASKGTKYAVCVAWDVLDRARKEGGYVNGTSGARARLWLEAHGEEVVTKSPRASYSCRSSFSCC